MKSVMIHQFNQIPSVNLERSSFNRSHGVKTTFDAGYLIPVYVDEALPGDTFNLRMSAFARLATPLKPVMDNMYIDSFFFAVPNRLVWNNWERFCGAQDDPDDTTDYTVPQMTGPDVNQGGIAQGSLADYMGLPTKALNGGGETTGIKFNSLHFRAYNLIWNTWFRDQNLQDSVVVDKDDGEDTYADYVLLRRGKRHDYFTSCLPWPQKGPDVELPLGAEAVVIEASTRGTANALVRKASDGTLAASGNLSNNASAVFTNDVSGAVYLDPNGTLAADLSSATASTINALRESFQLQKMYERDARGGTRYTEILRSHFGVISPDARLQRPEYLGGGSSPVNLHPVAQTGASETGKPQGNLAAFGTAAFDGHGFTKSFTEHCVLIGLVSVRADLTYQHGAERMWNRRTRFDYYWPSLAHLGEQAVLNREIYANLEDGTGAAQKDGVFGYQERFAEYRYKPSKITGLFRSNATGTLDYWHLSQDFGSQPTLNSAFIVEDPPVDRAIVTQTEPHFLFDAYFDLKCARPMPVYSIPGMIDHL